MTGLQDNVTEDVNKDGQELRVITVHLFYCLYKLSFTFKKYILLHFNENVTDNFKNYKFVACQSGYFGLKR